MSLLIRDRHANRGLSLSPFPARAFGLSGPWMRRLIPPLLDDRLQPCVAGRALLAAKLAYLEARISPGAEPAGSVADLCRCDASLSVGALDRALRRATSPASSQSMLDNG